MARLVHHRLLDVDDRADLGHRARPGIGVGVVGVGAGHVAMVDIGHHPHRHGHVCRRQPVLQFHAGGDGFAEFAPHAHRFPEDIGQTGGLGVVRDLGPSVDGGLDQRLSARRVVVVAIGEDRELRADRRAA